MYQVSDAEICLKVHVHVGIRYAKPPVGKLRFKKPEPADPWTGVELAQKGKGVCLQQSFDPNEGNFYHHVTSLKPGSHLPAMVSAMVPAKVITVLSASRTMPAMVPQEFGQAELSRQCRQRNDSPNALRNVFR